MRTPLGPVLLLLITGCTPAPEPQAADPLCTALRDLQTTGLAAAVAGVPGTLGSRADREVADERLERTRRALGDFVEASPEDIRTDSERVAAALERFIAGVNNPATNGAKAVAAGGATRQELRRTRASARRVNVVTQERCGQPLIDPAVIHP